jgi:uncharacterized membrane protein YeiH
VTPAQNEAGILWRTASGALVRERDRVDEHGVIKVACYNTITSGFRG